MRNVNNVFIYAAHVSWGISELLLFTKHFVLFGLRIGNGLGMREFSIEFNLQFYSKRFQISVCWIESVVRFVDGVAVGKVSILGREYLTQPLINNNRMIFHLFTHGPSFRLGV